MGLTGHALQNRRVLSCRLPLLSTVGGLVNKRHNTPIAGFLPLAAAAGLPRPLSILLHGAGAAAQAAHLHIQDGVTGDGRPGDWSARL
jgi:hypothetical protein